MHSFHEQTPLAFEWYPWLIIKKPELFISSAPNSLLKHHSFGIYRWIRLDFSDGTFTGLNHLSVLKLLTNTKPQTDLSFFGFNGKVRPETTAMVLESYQNDWNGRGQIKVMRWSIYTTQLSFDKQFVFYLNGLTIFLWCMWQPLRISVDHTRLTYSINNIDYQVNHLG